MVCTLVPAALEADTGGIWVQPGQPSKILSLRTQNKHTDLEMLAVVTIVKGASLACSALLLKVSEGALTSWVNGSDGSALSVNPQAVSDSPEKPGPSPLCAAICSIHAVLRDGRPALETASFPSCAL